MVYIVIFKNYYDKIASIFRGKFRYKIEIKTYSLGRV